MGVLPLQFPAGENAAALGLTGKETFHITGVKASLKAAAGKPRCAPSPKTEARRALREGARGYPAGSGILSQRRYSALRSAADRRRMTSLATREAIAATEPLIRPWIRRTPVLEVNPADFGLGCAGLFLKLEFLQYTGSFKPRGAFANLVGRKIPAAGVAAASGGNHGAAVAFAAQRLGLDCTIFVPSVAAPAKMERIRGYGAQLIVSGDRYAEALAASEEFVARSGAFPVHAYDAVETLLGQGSVGLELEQQAPAIDTLIVAVGGGGLIGGIAAWYAGRVRIVGVEPEAAPTLHRALAAGHPVDAPAGGIAADSLAPKRVGELMFPLAQQFVERVALVPDVAIERAQQVLWDVLRIAAEPGGAAAMSALLSGSTNRRPRNASRWSCAAPIPTRCVSRPPQSANPVPATRRQTEPRP